MLPVGDYMVKVIYFTKIDGKDMILFISKSYQEVSSKSIYDFWFLSKY